MENWVYMDNSEIRITLIKRRTHIKLVYQLTKDQSKIRIKIF